MPKFQTNPFERAAEASVRGGRRSGDEEPTGVDRQPGTVNGGGSDVDIKSLHDYARNLERRVPVLPRESHPEIESRVIEQQWSALLDELRKLIGTDPGLRKKMADFSSAKITEETAFACMQALAERSPVIQRLLQTSAELKMYLALPAVPEAALAVHVKGTPSSITPERYLESKLLEHADGPITAEVYEEVHARLSELSGLKLFHMGITPEERLLILRRYRFARDVKFLALAASVDEVPPLEPERKDPFVTWTLPSGVQLTGEREREQELAELFLHSGAWQKRKQIKDRVYEVSIGGKRYILKEEKTSRHEDTSGNFSEVRIGHVAKEEYAIAKLLQAQGRLKQGDVAVHWEAPQCFVSFPDGYRFVVFSFEERLQDGQAAHRTLTQAILKRREAFEAEFQADRVLTAAYLRDPRSLFGEKSFTESFLETVVRKIQDMGSHEDALTFEDFALVKAQAMLDAAQRLMKRAQRKSRLKNLDENPNDSAYRVNMTDDGVTLEIVGFDFEFYIRMSPEEAKLDEQHEGIAMQRMVNGAGATLGDWWSSFPESRVTSAQRAAYAVRAAFEPGMPSPQRDQNSDSDLLSARLAGRI